MYFVRTFNQDKYDARSKMYAEFKCDICGEIEWFDITGQSASFDKTRVRKCPSCKSEGKEDKIKNLNNEIEMLTENRKMIDVKLEMLIKEKELLCTKQ